MRTTPIEMLGTKLECRAYYCSHCRDTEGEPLARPKSIFYLMTSNRCNGSCDFCDIQKNFLNLFEPEPDLEKFRRVLVDLYTKDLISKISATGGDPLLNPERTNKLFKVIFEVNPEAKVDITTNGSLLFNLEKLDHADRLATIHISRHHFDTEKNNQVFQLKTATQSELEFYANRYPGKISLNCCLVPGYIDSPELVEQYLDWAATIKNIKSAGFISLMNKNEFCETSKVAEEEILHWIDTDKYNFGHDYNFDTDICQCRVWKRIPRNYHPITAFWWRVDRLDIPYCRQLVFTADNRITVNFNEIAEISF